MVVKEAPQIEKSVSSNDLTLFLLPILDEFIIQNNTRKVDLASSQTKLDIKINSTKPDKA